MPETTIKAAVAAAALTLAPPALLCAAAPPPITFTAVEPRFEQAAQEYRSLWRSEGERMVAALEGRAGIPFPPGGIEVFISEVPAMMSFDGRQMRLRASYPPAFRRAALVHELGHRLALALPRNAELDDHRLLYLFLYEVWTDLYGRRFADRMVAVERRVAGGYDYDSAWTWALAMTPSQRQERLRALRASAGASGA